MRRIDGFGMHGGRFPPSIKGDWCPLIAMRIFDPPNLLVGFYFNFKALNIADGYQHLLTCQPFRQSTDGCQDSNQNVSITKHWVLLVIGPKMTTLRRGQLVVVRGTVWSKILYVVLLNDCVIQQGHGPTTEEAR